jgi:hypothetical protein
MAWQGVLDTTLCDKDCYKLVTGRWFSPGTPDFSTNKTDLHNIVESAVKPHKPNQKSGFELTILVVIGTGCTGSCKSNYHCDHDNDGLFSVLGNILMIIMRMKDGHYKPLNCTPVKKVAIIVPYRDRESQLKIFLNNVIPRIYRQQLEFGIYIVEQVRLVQFNGL